MKLANAITIMALAFTVSGCKSLQNKIIVGTSTVLGFEIAQNPASQMYQIKFGYGRVELAIVPTNGVSVLTELDFHNVTGQGGLYQRMAVGTDAIRNSGFMFAKDASGNLNPQTAEAVAKAVAAIPAANPAGTANKVQLADAFSAAPNKAPFDGVAQSLGYANFAAFLLNTTLTADQVNAMHAALKAQGLAP